MGLDELDAIAEGVGSKSAFHTLHGFWIVLHFAALGRQGFEQPREITDQKCWMRFPGGTKIRFNAEMKL